MTHRNASTRSSGRLVHGVPGPAIHFVLLLVVGLGQLGCLTGRNTSLTVQLCLAQDPTADQLLSEDPFALLVGMILDQPKRIAWLPKFTTKQPQTASATWKHTAVGISAILRQETPIRSGRDLSDRWPHKVCLNPKCLAARPIPSQPQSI
jgi:hypothetical protein